MRVLDVKGAGDVLVEGSCNRQTLCSAIGQ